MAETREQNPSRRRHFIVSGFAHSERFEGTGRGREVSVPAKIRAQQASRLRTQLACAPRHRIRQAPVQCARAGFSPAQCPRPEMAESDVQRGANGVAVARAVGAEPAPAVKSRPTFGVVP